MADTIYSASTNGCCEIRVSGAAVALDVVNDVAHVVLNRALGMFGLVALAAFASDVTWRG